MTLTQTIIWYSIVFCYGCVIGSFANVCIYRLPLAGDIVKERSHCMQCGHVLKWYELIPLFSWLVLRGRCHSCGQKISIQYPLVEATNGLLYVILFAIYQWQWSTLLYCLLVTALLILSIIDIRTFEIPFGINIFIGVLGVIRVILDYQNWYQYLIGMCCVSLFLWLLFVISKGRAIGGGDVKLMAAAGLLLGWQLILLAFVVGCFLGSVIHLIRMRISNAEHVLAMGPYLAGGILIALIWGNDWIEWYSSFFVL